MYKPLKDGKPGKTLVAEKGEEIKLARLREIVAELGDDVAEGFSIPVRDAEGATAELNAFVILTENTRHFRPMGVAHVNPFLGLPPDAV